MSRSLNKQQKDKVSQFVSITGAEQRVAVECLQLGSWNVEAAIDYFYSSGLSSMASLRSGSRLDRWAGGLRCFEYEQTGVGCYV